MQKILPAILLLFLFIYTVQSQRNVILIIADDLGTDYFGFYEHHVDTVDVPNLRALTNRGIRFTQAYSNPVCSSTRAGMLTGRFGFRTGVGNVVGGEGGSGPLDINEMTIPKLLEVYKPNGIAKANIGKWHLQPAMPVANLKNPNIMGYDHFEGNFIGQLPDYNDWSKVTNGISTTITTYATTETTNNAINWIKNQDKQQPFFLWLAYNAPHTPFHLPPANLHTYQNLSGTQQDINANPKSYFKAMVQAMDTEMGRLFDSLNALQKLDSTDIIFIGDNGNTRQTAQNSDILRSKGTVYENGVHIPMMIAGPSVVNAGRQSDALVNTADLFVTIPELFGYMNWQSAIPGSTIIDAISILPIIKQTSENERPWVFVEIFKNEPDQADGKAIRNESYKLLQFDSGQQEFYNLTTDRSEINNLLKGELSTEDIENYNYLCTKLMKLVGVNTSCISPNLEYQISPVIVYPNPWTDFIHLDHLNGNEHFDLYNVDGKSIYSGSSVQKQDFSYLPKGVYYLKITSEKQSTYKLFKM